MPDERKKNGSRGSRFFASMTWLQGIKQFSQSTPGYVWRRTAVLFGVVQAHQHADEFTYDLTMVIVQALQISNQFDIG